MKNILLSIYVFTNRASSIEMLRNHINHFYNTLELDFTSEPSNENAESNINIIQDFIANKQKSLDKEVTIKADLQYYEENIDLPPATIFKY